MRKAYVATILLTALVVAIVKWHEVPIVPTPADAAASHILLGANTVPRRPSTFADEIRLVLAVQHRVLQAAPINDPIPNGHPRELRDLLSLGHGLCYDRSRAVETALRLGGMEVRHIAVYSEVTKGSALGALLSPGVPSHAVTEVKTQRGWMLVDSNRRWVGLTSEDEPISIEEVDENPNRLWSKLNGAPLDPIFRKQFTWVYGLYSRHGKFYPPYDPIPDLNWSELAQNL